MGNWKVAVWGVRVGARGIIRFAYEDRWGELLGERKSGLFAGENEVHRGKN